ncbi:hypothetical protein [Fictibacillus enclensis]|uniref:hypothetical protein n=1 Tax=Fictibacillus enclensis TaxID=1017270 RepID=UPI0024BF1F17|nr:hypothetical protein [Fictibacillus enclensis]WHY71926.1 hypothetical protein QNH15_23530 [Fictibacillus enclensis]
MKNLYSIRPQDFTEFENMMTDFSKRATMQPSDKVVEVKVIKTQHAPVAVVIDSKEDDSMKPEKRRLTVEEKLKLAEKIVGKAKYFDREGLRESDCIANREDWEEDAE